LGFSFLINIEFYVALFLILVAVAYSGTIWMIMNKRHKPVSYQLKNKKVFQSQLARKIEYLRRESDAYRNLLITQSKELTLDAVNLDFKIDDLDFRNDDYFDS
jgi:hypothetical protein